MERQGAAEPFLIKDEHSEASEHSPQHGALNVYHIRDDQKINMDRKINDDLINTTTAVPASYFASAGASFHFKVPSQYYRVKHISLEFDVRNGGASAVTLAPSAFMVDRIRIKNGSGNILQEIPGIHLWHDICAMYDGHALDSVEALYNIDSATKGSFAAIAAGATKTYSIPLHCSFLEQLHFFCGGLGPAGLDIEVISPGSTCVESGTAGDLVLQASRLRVTCEWYGVEEVVDMLQDAKSFPHTFKFLDTPHQTWSQSLTSGGKVTVQANSLNGLIPYAFLVLRNSLTGTGLYAIQAITDYEILDKTNKSLQNGHRMPDYISRGPVAAREFKTDFFSVHAVTPMCFCEDPMRVQASPVNIGAEGFIDNFLSITANSTGTYTIELHAKRWSSLVQSTDGALKVISS
jgi:hypothetical protein